jgi:hypothetical protein
MFLPCGAGGCDFPANAWLTHRFKQCRLNLVSLSTVDWATAWVKRDKATVIAKGRQQRGNGLVNLFGLHKKS